MGGTVLASPGRYRFGQFRIGANALEGRGQDEGVPLGKGKNREGEE